MKIKQFLLIFCVSSIYGSGNVYEQAQGIYLSTFAKPEVAILTDEEREVNKKRLDIAEKKLTDYEKIRNRSNIINSIIRG